MSYFFSALTVLEVIFVLALLLYFLRWIWNRKRKPTSYYGQTMEDAKPAEPDTSTPDLRADGSEKLSPQKRRSAIGFLSVWIFFWSVGIYLAFTKWRSLAAGEEGYTFIMLWLAFAILGWVFAAWTIFRLLRGDDIEIED